MHQVKDANPSIQVHIHRTNISIEDDVSAMVDTCVSAFGRLDYAMNIAGIVPQRQAIAEVDVETYERVIDVNVHGVRIDVVRFSGASYADWYS